MLQVNVFKIHKDKEADFTRALEQGGSLAAYNSTGEKKYANSRYRFFYALPEASGTLVWGWAFRLFGKKQPTVCSSPKGFITIRRRASRDMYVISFGGAHFDVDGYADQSFGLKFASQFKMQELKLAAVTNIGSKRNKSVHSYRKWNYDHLELNSGESYTKLKITADFPRGSRPYTPLIEAGTSIKLNLSGKDIEKNVSLETLDKFMDAIEEMASQIKQGNDELYIPRFDEVSEADEPDLVKKLDMKLKKGLRSATDNSITMAEFDTIGTDVEFYGSERYKISCKGKSGELKSFDIDSVKEFFRKYKIRKAEDMLSAKIELFAGSTPKGSRELKKLLEYVVDEDHALLINGRWYQYNKAYVDYLHDSLSQITVRKGTLNICGKEEHCFTSSQVETWKKQIKGGAVYKEYALNNMKSLEKVVHGEFKLGDRDSIKTIYGKNKLEICDLLEKRDGRWYIIATKISNQGSALCYAVDQSEAAMEWYVSVTSSKNIPNGYPTSIHGVVLWLVFERAKEFGSLEKPSDWGKIGFFYLKNRINSWKQKAILAGLKPEIWISYLTP